MKIGFDSEKYMQIQSKHILERIDSFGGKLYLEINQRFGRQVQQLLHDAGLHDAAVARDQYGRWRYAWATM